MRPSDALSYALPLPSDAPSYAPSCALPLLHLSLPPMPFDSPFL